MTELLFGIRKYHNHNDPMLESSSHNHIKNVGGLK